MIGIEKNAPALARRSAQHALSRLAIVALTLGLVAACGGGSSKPSTPAAPQPSSSVGNPGAFRGGALPGASGQIAEIDGNTLQVQSQTTQVAVLVTAKTAYTQTKAATVAAVVKGSCVVATAPAAATGATTAPTSGPRTITASTVIITAAVGRSCTGGFGAAGGTGRSSNFPTDRPSNFPTGTRSNFPGGAGGRGGFGDIVTGAVTAVSGSTITVQAQERTAGSSSTTTVTDTVTVTASTTFAETVAATQAALKVGLCANATGSAGSDGTITASRVALSSPANGACTATGRFGGFGGGTGGGTGGTGGTGG